MRKEAIPFDSLDNGFLWCADPERLQQLADSLSPADVQAFFDRWLDWLPWPLTPVDRNAGYRHRLSIWQLEMSLTQVFTKPIYGRQFFEAVIRDNLDLGRPDRVSLLFPTRLTRRTPPPDLGYKTRVITYGVAPSLHVEFKHSHVKQYFKEQRALRTETTINDPLDFLRTKGLDTLPHLRAIGRQINARLLHVERVGDGVIPAPSFFERLQLPTLSPTGQRVSALRFGDPRAQALFGALCHFNHLPSGFRNGDLRPVVAALLGRDVATYGAGAMTYDLRRLRLHGVIRRVPHTLRYTLTADGMRAAFALHHPLPSSAPPVRISSAHPRHRALSSRRRPVPVGHRPARSLEHHQQGRLTLTPPEKVPFPLKQPGTVGRGIRLVQLVVGSDWPQHAGMDRRSAGVLERARAPGVKAVHRCPHRSPL